MRVTFSETQEDLQRTLRGLLAARAPLDGRGDTSASDAGYDADLLAELVGLGFVGLTAPPEVGGADSDPVHLGVVLEELGRGCVPGPFLTMAASVEVLKAADSPWARELLGAVVRGDRRAALVPAPRHGDTGVVVDGDGRLHAEGLLVEWAAGSDVLLVEAVGGGGALSPAWGLHAVDPSAPGVTLRPVEAIDDVRIARLDLAGVEALDAVPASGERAGPDPWSVLAWLRAAEVVGGAAGMLEMTLAHVRDRRQFGKPLGAFQAVQQRCADAAILLRGARLAVYELLWRWSGGRSVARHGAVACFLAGRAAEHLAVTASLLHGGVGYMVEHPLHHFFCRAKGHRLRLGATRDQLDRIAASVLDGDVSGRFRLDAAGEAAG